MRTHGESFARNHAMAADKTAKPADDDISPYLQQPLRTLETAQQDCERRHREAADVAARTKRPD